MPVQMVGVTYFYCDWLGSYDLPNIIGFGDHAIFTKFPIKIKIRIHFSIINMIYCNYSQKEKNRLCLIYTSKTSETVLLYILHLYHKQIAFHFKHANIQNKIKKSNFV